MENNKGLRRIFFIGAGGIGMANLVRYALAEGYEVAGYDRTPSALTDSLQSEGAELIFEDAPDLIPSQFFEEDTLVVYTPAVPENTAIMRRFRNSSLQMVKRAALLGQLTREAENICVAGSHGKTTTSSMIAHILYDSHLGCNAFLGGISRNYGSNLLISPETRFAVVEADEFDRSFHHLSPFIAVITSVDPDHLDIYGNAENYREAFCHFTSLIKHGGALVVHTGLNLPLRVHSDVKVFTYSGLEGGDYHAEKIRYNEGELLFDFRGPDIQIDNISLGVPVEINIDNAVAAGAAAHIAGATDDEIRRGIETFKGAKRRFEIYLDGKEEGGKVVIDDYAHSPKEVKASIESVKKLYPGRKLTVIFQPHLYTRTRDFAHEFALSLNTADEIILTEIYPAREEPIEGVDSGIIFKEISNPNKKLCQRKDLLNLLEKSNFEVIMTLGAADIDRIIPDIIAMIRKEQY